MKENNVKVYFDRRKRAKMTGRGKVDLCIYLSRKERKFLTIFTCSPVDWRKYQKSKELKNEVTFYQYLVKKMSDAGEDMTISNLNKYLSRISFQSQKEEKAKNKNTNERPHCESFIRFMYDEMSKEECSRGTIAHKLIAVRSVIRFGMLKSFSDLKPENVRAFDEFLHKECKRAQTTINNYHKVVRKYTQLAYLYGFIESDPYKHPLCRFSRGTSKERCPLTEDELVMVRDMKDLPRKLARARDLFIFCAYTGLTYADSQLFDFDLMTEFQDGLYFIDGVRMKTGQNYFTPILPGAMEVLKRNDFKVPKLSNQKANHYLHIIEKMLNLRKPLTVHVGRHTFATLLLTHDVPMENIGRMLGHASLKTTQIYARILHSTIQRHAAAVVAKLK